MSVEYCYLQMGLTFLCIIKLQYFRQATIWFLWIVTFYICLLLLTRPWDWPPHKVFHRWLLHRLWQLHLHLVSVHLLRPWKFCCFWCNDKKHIDWYIERDVIIKRVRNNRGAIKNIYCKYVQILFLPYSLR